LFSKIQFLSKFNKYFKNSHKILIFSQSLEQALKIFVFRYQRVCERGVSVSRSSRMSQRAGNIPLQDYSVYHKIRACPKKLFFTVNFKKRDQNHIIDIFCRKKREFDFLENNVFCFVSPNKGETFFKSSEKL